MIRAVLDMMTTDRAARCRFARVEPLPWFANSPFRIQTETGEERSGEAVQPGSDRAVSGGNAGGFLVWGQADWRMVADVGKDETWTEWNCLRTFTAAPGGRDRVATTKRVSPSGSRDLPVSGTSGSRISAVAAVPQP